jgi:hypothetical protein
MLDAKRRELIALLGAGGLLLAVKVRRGRWLPRRPAPENASRCCAECMGPVRCKRTLIEVADVRSCINVHGLAPANHRSKASKLIRAGSAFPRPITPAARSSRTPWWPRASPCSRGGSTFERIETVGPQPGQAERRGRRLHDAATPALGCAHLFPLSARKDTHTSYAPLRSRTRARGPFSA